MKNTKKGFLMRISILFVLLAITIVCSAQKKYLLPPTIIDQELVDSIVTKNASHSSKIMIYHSMTENSHTVFLAIQKTPSIYPDFWCVVNGKNVLSGTLSSDSLFLYPNFKLTGATEKDKHSNMTFVPPMGGTGLNTELVIYRDTNITFFFEFGDNVTMHKDVADKIPYQKEWLEIVRKELDKVVQSRL